jgi:hypothetical protein
VAVYVWWCEFMRIQILQSILIIQAYLKLDILLCTTRSEDIMGKKDGRQMDHV